MSIKAEIRRLLRKLPYETYVSFLQYYRKVTKFLKINKLEEYRGAYFYKKDKNSKEKYCIFRMAAPFGIFAVARRYVFSYEFAISKGFIPLMDFSYEYNFQQYNLGDENLWEYIFEQPITVKEALKKNHVIVGDLGANEWSDEMCLDINGAKDDCFIHAKQKDWRNYYAKVHPYVKKCWLLKQNILDDYIEKCGYKIRIADKILGVALREEFASDTNHSEEHLKMYNIHPSVPGVEETMGIVKEYMKKWNCNKIFLSAQCKESLDLFLDEFGEDRVIFLVRERMSVQEFSKMPRKLWEMNEKEFYEYSHRISVEEAIKNTTIPYVEEVLGLSECDYFIGAKSSGTIAALSLNGGKYKDIYILPDKNKIARY